MKIDHSISWEVLTMLVNNKFIRSFSIWLVLVPILSKFLVGIPEKVTIPLIGYEFEIAFALPFNISAFYFSACFFTLAHITYLFFCPDLIKKYKCFKDFHEDQTCSIYLSEQISHLTEIQQDSIKEKYKNFDGLNSIELRDAYGEIFSKLKLIRYKAKRCILSFYSIGFVCLIWVFVSNTLTVMKGF